LCLSQLFENKQDKSWHGECNCRNESLNNRKIVMKALPRIALLSLLVAAQSVSAAEVVGEVSDTTAGKVFGGTTGLLVGGAIAGGPVGALVGGLLGVFGGGLLQQETGLGQRAYQVKSADCALVEVRSPNASFAPGDDVIISGNRLKAQ
jgi:hypothetical protein